MPQKIHQQVKIPVLESMSYLHQIKGIIPAKSYNTDSVRLNRNSFFVKQSWAKAFYQNILIKNQFFYVLKIKIHQICNRNQTLQK